MKLVENEEKEGEKDGREKDGREKDGREKVPVSIFRERERDHFLLTLRCWRWKMQMTF